MQHAKRLREAVLSATLRIDPHARFSADADELDVIGRRGRFSIRAKDIRKLHERMQPLLDGRFTPEQLIGAAGDKRSAVRKYLDGLKQAGALSGGPAIDSLPNGFPMAITGTQTLRLAGLRIVVSLDRFLEPRRRTLLVQAGCADQVEKLLLGRRRISAGATEIVVEIDESDDAGSLEGRARIIKHLLAVVLSADALEAGMSIYKAGPGMTLHRRAVLRPRERRQLSVSAQMNLVRQADIQQAPLVVCAGELPGHQRRCLGIGVSAQDVEPLVLLNVVARTYLSIAASRGECISVHRFSTRATRGSGPVNIVLTPEMSERATLGFSRLDCIQALLCSYVLQHFEAGRGRRCDLLREVPASPRIAMLQQLLHLKRDTYEGYLEDQRGPVVVFHGDRIKVARLGYEETIAEALVRAVAAEYYCSVVADVVAVPGTLSPSGERRRLYGALRAFPALASFSVGRFRRMGLTFHVGMRLGSSGVVPDSDNLPNCGTRQGDRERPRRGK